MRGAYQHEGERIYTRGEYLYMRGEYLYMRGSIYMRGRVST